MSEFISLNDAVYFTANFYHPVSGFSYAADTTPAWYVYESGAALILNGSMTARNGITGSYWGSFDATSANGFSSSQYYDVQVSGTVAGVNGFVKIKDFVVDDIFDANVVSVSGVLITSDNSTVDANVVQVNGEAVDYEAGIVDANILQVSGEYVDIGDFGGTGSSLTAEQVRVEMDANSAALIAISGNVAGLNGDAMRGTDNAALATDLITVSGVINTVLEDTNELQSNQGNWLTATGFATPENVALASGDIISRIDGLNNFDPATMAVSVSGIPTVNVVQVSGEYVSIDDFGGGAGGAGASASEVWEYANRSLTEAVSVSGIVDANVVQVSGQYVLQESIIDANIVQISGEYISASAGYPDVNVIQVSGEQVSINDFGGAGSSLTAEQVRVEMDTNSAALIGISGVVYGLNDLSAADVNAEVDTALSEYDGATRTQLMSVSGVVDTVLEDTNELQTNQSNWLTATGFATPTDVLSASGAIIDSIGALNDFNPATTAVSVSGVPTVNVVQVSGQYVSIDDFGGTGGAGASASEVWEYADRSLTEAVSVSGVVDANTVQISGVPVSLSNEVVDANMVQISGVPISLSSTVDANLTQINGEAFEMADAVSVSGIVSADVVKVSGEYVSINDFKADVSSLDSDIYFAQIKHIQDVTNNADEFVVHWFRNDQPVSSGELTSPALSVYNTSTGAAVLEHQGMSYASPNIGSVRHNSSPIILASGEPYLIETSGTISSSVRTWRSIVGIDVL